jgi:hypothetical protein
MRILLISGVVFASFAIAPGARAQNYPWCAHYDKGDGGMNCGFTSFAQCLTDVSGLGGFCEQNNTYVPPAAPAPSPHRPHKSS